MPSNLPTAKSISASAGGRLYVVATPIGNLDDITLRALKVLAAVELIAAEDTRHTLNLLNAHNISKPLVSYHEHNEEKRSEELIRRLQAGEDIALTTNAGTPLVSDPGYRLVEAAIAAGIETIPIPGVSAVVTALSVCGLPTDRFTFVGFPARKKTKRLQDLSQLAQAPQTLIFYQSPHRIPDFLEEIRSVMGDRPAVLARELTKIHEEFLRGTLSEISAALQHRETLKGECTLLVAGQAADQTCSAQDLEQALATAFARRDESLSTIAKTLASQLGISRKAVYDAALRLQSDIKRKEGQ
jgi:16S rRNA (cytidine1402-2'-O)-methyltransferase